MTQRKPLRIVIFGLAITSSWGNGHATTYRALVRGLASRGHRVSFWERQRRWYADHRDLPRPDYCDVHLYESLAELESHFRGDIDADLVIVGSYVPEGIRVAEWVLSRARGATAFYDIDTPVTLARLDAGECTYLSPSQVPEFDLYLSFTAGPTLERLQRKYGAQHARPLFCSVDEHVYFPEPQRTKRYDVGYLGTYSVDRQAKLEALLMEPAKRSPEGRFCVAGAQYPQSVEWPQNVKHIEHLPPCEHRRFYNEQRFTLNVTRADMVASGHSPSVRLFEAAACGVPIISDKWNGLEEIFEPGREILIAHSTEDILFWLRNFDADEARDVGARARERVLSAHTASHRAHQLENYVYSRGTALRDLPHHSAPQAAVEPALQ